MTPFRMFQVTRMEKYRARSFWTKEPETIKWIQSFNDTDVFFDVGANIGVYSLFAASLYPKMQIYAFEPVRANYERLCANIAINSYTNIRPYPYAISEMTEVVEMEIPNDETGASGAQAEYYNSSSGTPPVLSLALTEWGIKPTYVKVDIDGQEEAVICGMGQTLTYVQSLLVEVSSKSKKAVVSLLRQTGFTTKNKFNTMMPHSRERRLQEGIDAENIIFTR